MKNEKRRSYDLLFFIDCVLFTEGGNAVSERGIHHKSLTAETGGNVGLTERHVGGWAGGVGWASVLYFFFEVGALGDGEKKLAVVASFPLRGV